MGVDADNLPMPSRPAELEERLARLAVLQEPLRRALHLYVIAQAGEVGRDEAAEALGIGRNLAAFHLDKLADAGLLQVSYRRLTGRSGPGAGRPAKLYRRSGEDLQVSLPPRDYQLAAHLMAAAIEEAVRVPVIDALRSVARRFGEALGREARQRLPARAGLRRRLAGVAEVLSRYGYSPYEEAGELRMRNCPFHSLARDRPALACGMNLALMEGIVAGVGGGGARLEPRRDQCCVVLAATRVPPGRTPAEASARPRAARSRASSTDSAWS